MIATVPCNSTDRKGGVRRVRGFKVAGLTQGRPTTAETPGGRLVKLTVRVPDDAFNAIEATMDVPAEYLEAPVVIESEAPTNP